MISFNNMADCSCCAELSGSPNTGLRSRTCQAGSGLFFVASRGLCIIAAIMAWGEGCAFSSRFVPIIYPFHVIRLFFNKEAGVRAA